MGNQITITDENKIKNIIMKGIKEKEVDLSKTINTKGITVKGALATREWNS